MKMSGFRSISTENKGFKMLAKMGWKSGNRLGKNEQGIAEPVSPFSKFFFLLFLSHVQLYPCTLWGLDL